MLTLDSSAVLAILNRADRHHMECVSTLEGDSGPFLIPAATLGEIAWLLESRLEPAAKDALFEDLRRGAYLIDCGERDFGRIQALDRRYRDLPLGFVDAAVVACAERNGGRVLTLDRRHFSVVMRGEGTLEIPLAES